MSGYISIPEAARRLGRSPTSVKRLIARGVLRVSRPDPRSHARVLETDIAAWILRAKPADLAKVRMPQPA
jgi:excisionase family DNA binding protein